MIGRRALARPLLVLGDALLLSGAFQASYWLRFELHFLPQRPIPAFDFYMRLSFVVAILGVVSLHSAGLYRLRRLSYSMEDTLLIVRSVTQVAIIVIVMGFVFRGYIPGYEFETYSRLIIFINWLLASLGLCVWRWCIARGVRCLRRKGIGVKRALIVGTEGIGRGFASALSGKPEAEYTPVGFLSDGPSASMENTQPDGPPVLGELHDLSSVLKAHDVDEVVLTSVEISQEDVAQMIKTCQRVDVQFSMVPGFLGILTRQMRVMEVAEIPVFQLEERIFQRWARLTKRSMDVALSLLVIVPLAPLWLTIAAIIRLDSGGGAIFRQVRVGKGERPFLAYKFRSMLVDAEKQRAELMALHRHRDGLLPTPDVTQVTRLGRLLRRFSIDEVPQVLNVLLGEMSWVGPRPHIPPEVEQYSEWHKRRFDVLPGITGLTQITGRKDLSLDEMVRRDIYYIENWSPWLDLQILLRTIPAVLGGKGAY